MDNIFKRLGIGIVSIVCAPLWIAYFLIYIIYASINLIISPFKILYYFLKGRKYTIKSHYDLQAEAILNQEPNLNANNNPPPNNNQQPINININYVPNQNPNFPNNNQINIPSFDISNNQVSSFDQLNNQFDNNQSNILENKDETNE